MAYLLLIASWILGAIIMFATGHPLWGIAAVILPPVGIAVGGFWIVAFAIAIVGAVLA